MQLPEPLPAPATPARSMAIGTGELDRRLADDEGPENGLTLDAAIDRMMADNIDIRALRHEITQADADILTAGLRTNPLVYLDSQFIPYGSFTDATPGGPTQYDFNITYPLDVSRKRQARTVVARMAKTALEAQFQDVVRRQIDNVNKAFVGLQAARIDMLVAESSVRRAEALLEEEIREAKALPATDVAGRRKAADLERELGFSCEKAKIAALDATEAYEDAQETLALLPQADLLLFSGNHAQFGTPEFQKAIRDFGAAGKGIVLLHAATWYNWPLTTKYNDEFVCGGARGHGHSDFTFTVTKPEHPVMKGVPATFVINDESYNVELTRPEGAEVLGTIPRQTPKEGLSNILPSVWTVKYPGTKVVCIALGHDDKSHDHPAYKQLLLNSLAWVANK
jgi:type 1 glutamine amidotransferase